MEKLPPIIISSLDYERLEQLLEMGNFSRTPGADALYEELGRATVLAPEQIPAGLVTMNSLVRCTDDSTGKVFEVTLVYPAQADASSGKVSVLAPVGSALLGLSVGQSIDWPVPGGRTMRLRVSEVVYQPEASGEFEQ